ncbi:MAG: 2-amino-4-hydroxy-6-hydroxymethyldihydropteridine diphosphokinase [Heliobacteriaceae bacterium]|jgi:2-amino-4-hydroxy-6-hydroxymethyldihydropteridine diphosphokinase|nr:2-amino-4-hydroxy-6-hydroxymethyldihydropteridine diphosphokinase [Heliobacteriaceae bacterium]
MAIVYLSLGSNLGDRIGYIQQATRLLGEAEGITLVRTSAFYETEPWDMESTTWFVNAVVEVKTSLTPQKLLSECERIEQQLGRSKKKKGGYSDRTIDIDILFYNRDIINDENITIPHKFLHLRAFNLVPLLELIPDYIHPVLNKSVMALHESLEDPEMVFLYGTRIE